MASGLLESTASVELAGDYFQGHLADGLDQTFDAFLRLRDWPFTQLRLGICYR